ncbi:MAG: T9SS type A sorting domain-containing protein [Candidatus Eisenbacteria bacterium]|nr:T9SS type A sorting domain-containing protein [Candidatus Eisenbacteria bacterium]
MRTHAALGVLTLLFLVAVATAEGAHTDRAQMTTLAFIDSEVQRGALDGEQAVLLKAYSVYAPWNLPEEYRGGLIDKCGNPTIAYIERALPTLSAGVAEEIRSLRARPTAMTYIDTEHFRIHYDTSGTHKILNWPDTTYRDAIATAAENSWTVEVGTLGFRQPPSDAGFPDNGGDGRYDIYVRALSGVYGYCQGEYYEPSTPQNDATSFVVIDNDYAGFGYPNPQDPMKVTVAHEFNHSCQFAHDVDEDTWYKEATSTWVEDIVYDSINDYRQYVSSFLNYPYYALDANTTGGLRIYGACIWNFCLSEVYGNAIVPAIWYQCEAGTATFTNMNIALQSYGTSLKDEVRRFSIWNFFTGNRNDGSHYEEGGTWTLAPMQAVYNSYPIVSGAPSASLKPDHLGCNYIRFSYASSGLDGLRVAYDGPNMNSSPNAADINYVRLGGTMGYEYGGIPLNGFGNGEITVNEWNQKAYVCLVVSNLSTSVNDMSYTYSVDEVDTGVEDAVFDLALKAASPNPFSASTAIAYTVPTGGGLVDITIYDVAGREVRKLVSAHRAAGDGTAVWDGRDDGGAPVAAGVYFAKLDVDGLTASGKLLMLK